MRPKDVDERISRLPQWAQSYIVRLECDVAALKEEHRKIDAGETHVFWTQWMNDVRYHIPDNAAIVFRTASGRVECKLTEIGVTVRTDGQLEIYPKTSNNIVVKSTGY